MKKIILTILITLSNFISYADTQIIMEEYNGVYRIPCTLNGAKMKLIFDTGASNVCLSMSMAEYLFDNGFIEKEDIIGTGSSSVADGRIVDHVICNLKDIEIQGIHLYNVQAVVIDGQNAPLLMGQSAIQKLGDIQISGNLLTIKNDIQDSSAIIDDLFNRASTAYDDKLYNKAAELYGQLYSMNQLSDYGVFKYAWALLMSENPQKASQVLSNLSNYNYFDDNYIDVYVLLAYINQDLENYNEAIVYFEKSSNLQGNKIFNDKGNTREGIAEILAMLSKNYQNIADCYRYSGNDSKASEFYWKAVTAVYSHAKDINSEYIMKDLKGKLKKNQKSYRTDELDYCIFYYYNCSMLSGTYSTESCLFELTALARGGNKYAQKHLNAAGIDPYSDIWK